MPLSASTKNPGFSPGYFFQTQHKAQRHRVALSFFRKYK